MGDRLGRIDLPRAGFGALLAALTLAAPAAAGSLPTVGSGHRPGPDALYEPAAKPAQLENGGPWKAPPILVSGAEAYRSGEYLYQDYLYDDHGASKSKDLSDPFSFGDFLFSPKAGTLTYPAGPDFAHNGADLVELRAKPVAGATAFRVTLNTLKNPGRTGFTIAIGDSDSARVWPHKANVRSPAELFLTVHGTSAELVDAATGAPRGPAPSASVDVRRRQFDVRVPHAAWNPGGGSVRLAAGVGVWDTGSGNYAMPHASASAANVGGGSASTASLFNVAFRFDEPYPDVSQSLGGYTIADAAVGAGLDGAWWRERQQAENLAKNDVSRFATEVDFAKLATKARTVMARRRVKAGRGRTVALPRVKGRRLVSAVATYRGKTIGRARGRALKKLRIKRPTRKAFTVRIRARTNAVPQADDDSGVPATGSITRILASRHQFGQGVDFAKLCGGITAFGSACDGGFVGELQPYSLYVPRKAQPRRGWGMTLLLHSLAANYNQYSNSMNQSQLGLRGPGSLVATPNGRGPDGAYREIAEADTFEVWADVARHYALDPDWTVVSGYSMGGGGTFRYLERYPDLFARGAAVVGPSEIPGLPSIRNVPIMTWAAALDELVNIGDTEANTNALIDNKLRFVADLFLVSDHLTLATNDEYGPVADFLGTHRVNRDPAHVTYVVQPETDSARSGAIADHAYWLSAIKPAPGHDEGTIDIESLGFGTGDPEPGPVKTSNGLLLGGVRGTMPYLRRERGWGAAPVRPKQDKLVVRAQNVASATVDTKRARLSCAPQVEFQNPVALKLVCPAVARTNCANPMRLALPRVKGRRIVAAVVTYRGRTIARTAGRNLRRLSIRRPARGKVTLRIRLRTSGPKARRITVTRSFRACG